MPGLLLVLTMLSAPAEPVSAPVAVAVRAFESNPEAADLAPGLAALLSERVRAADPAWTLCVEEDGCARYVVSGRVDRFGDRYVLIGRVDDREQGRVIAEARREVTDPAKLPAALDGVAEDLLVGAGVKRPTETGERLDTTGFTCALKLSTQLITSIEALAPGGVFEIGWRITPALQAFFELSFATTFTDGSGSTQLLPGVLGARYYFRAGKSFQPYVGGGVGLVVAVKALQGQARPSLWAHGGVAYLFFNWFGLVSDFGVDVLGAAFDLFGNQRTGVNLALSLGVLFRV